MKILLVSATSFEILPLMEQLEAKYKSKGGTRFFSKTIDIHLLVTGVGPIHTAFALGTVLGQHTFDWVINLGIAGSFNRDLALGTVVQVVRDRFADVGVEEADGSFTDLFEMGLQEADEAPYEGGQLQPPLPDGQFLPQVSAITVSKVHGTAASIEKIQAKYPADLESMEGAAVFYACLQHRCACLQIRAISNYVEPRNKDNWDIPLAINQLNQTAWELLQTLEEQQAPA